MIRRENKADEVTDPSRTLIGPHQDYHHANTNNKKRLREYTLKLQIMNKGQLVAFNDVLFNRVHTTQMHCISSKGVLLVMRAEEFVEKMQKMNISWDYLLLNAYEKDMELKFLIQKARGIKPAVKEEKQIIERKEPIPPAITIHKDRKLSLKNHYTTIMSRHHVKPSQDKIDDFRSTLTEIVTNSEFKDNKF